MFVKNVLDRWSLKVALCTHFLTFSSFRAGYDNKGAVVWPRRDQLAAFIAEREKCDT